MTAGANVNHVMAQVRVLTQLMDRITRMSARALQEPVLAATVMVRVTVYFSLAKRAVATVNIVPAQVILVRIKTEAHSTEPV